jgi:excisionase family protein
MSIYKPKDFAKMLNVSVKTLQRWDNEDTLKAYRNPKGRRYYTYEQYLAFTGISSKTNKKIVIYTRVSTTNQKDDLNNQVEFLKNYANSKGLIINEIITDIGSGLNYTRKKWNDLINDCINQKVQTIIISNKDRFIRFGYDWFERFLLSYGVNIIIVNNNKLSPNEELIQDLISIIHIFSCKIYGLKKYIKSISEDKDVNQL